MGLSAHILPSCSHIDPTYPTYFGSVSAVGCGGRGNSNKGGPTYGSARRTDVSLAPTPPSLLSVLCTLLHNFCSDAWLMWFSVDQSATWAKSEGNCPYVWVMAIWPGPFWEKEKGLHDKWTLLELAQHQVSIIVLNVAHTVQSGRLH